MERKPQIIIAKSHYELSHLGADIFMASANEAVAERGRFIAAISGGESPRPMYRLFAEEIYQHKIPWYQTHIFWVDERCVPVDHPYSNYGLAHKDFIEVIKMPSSRIHGIPADLLPEESASIYEQDILNLFKPEQGEVPSFDLIFMGIGLDGHTASLFPGSEALEEKEKLVVSTRGGEPFLDRITMTLPLLNNARKIIFLISGENKAEIVHDILERREKRLPAQMINPIKGELIWILDQAAASLLLGMII